jgi:hypothetical protein
MNFGKNKPWPPALAHFHMLSGLTSARFIDLMLPIPANCEILANLSSRILYSLIDLSRPQLSLQALRSLCWQVYKT